MAVACVLLRICTANLAPLPASDSSRESPSAWQQTERDVPGWLQGRPHYLKEPHAHGTHEVLKAHMAGKEKLLK